MIKKEKRKISYRHDRLMDIKSSLFSFSLFDFSLLNCAEDICLGFIRSEFFRLGSSKRRDFILIS